MLLELNQLMVAFQQQIAARGGAPPNPGTPSPHDVVRRKYLAQLHQKTGRAVIVYESAFLESRPFDPNSVSVNLGDIAGFVEACSNINDVRSLDLLLHSPGGQAEAAESILKYLRARFDHIRVIVPHAAMSAATMLALGADEIVMGDQSQLGPIDPQVFIQTPEGPRGAPGQAILDQFEQAKKECGDPKNLPAWLPILRMYGPGLISDIERKHELAQELVAGWLETYMFRGQSDAHERAQKAAAWFADFSRFKSHGRPVHLDEIRQLGIRATRLEDDPELQDAVLSVHHAMQLTLGQTMAAKVIENHAGRAFVVSMAQVQIPVPLMAPPLGAPGRPTVASLRGRVAPDVTRTPGSTQGRRAGRKGRR